MTRSPWQPLYQSPSVTLGDFLCPHGSSEVSREEYSETNDLAFVRRGMFVKHVRGRKVVADTNHVVFFNRGEAYRVSHPVCTGDRCITLSIAESTLREMLVTHNPAAADRSQLLFSQSAAPIHAQVCLRLRLLVSILADPTHDRLAVDELAFDLADSALGSLNTQSIIIGRRVSSDTQLVHDELTERTKHVLSQHLKTGVSLDLLARHVHSSPYHLSRVFRQNTGTPIHRYLIRLRLRHSLDYILEGERDLTRLALDYGFNDHSHFTNAFRREFGMAPSACRTQCGRRALRQLSKNRQAARSD